MTDPTPPEDLPEEVLETLQGLTPERLRALSAYADRLADARAMPAGGDDDGWDGDDGGDDVDGDEDGAGSGAADATGTEAPTADRPDVPPEGVPSKATLTVKEIKDNRYYYWQWREGDSIKSQYIGPVGGTE